MLLLHQRLDDVPVSGYDRTGFNLLVSNANSIHIYKYINLKETRTRNSHYDGNENIFMIILWLCFWCSNKKIKHAWTEMATPIEREDLKITYDIKNKHEYINK